MKNILIIIFLAISISARTQITLEHDYDSAATIISGSPSVYNQLMIVNFTVSGEKYVKINRLGKSIEIYDLSHALQKTIDCSSFPMIFGAMGNVIYLSENLFSTDSKIAFMYGFSNGTSATTYTGIYEEDGTLLFSDTCAPIVYQNTPLQQYPIYNTSEGTKMILSYLNIHAKVFSLPGTLTTSIQETNNNLIAMQTGRVSNAYPNPNNGSTKIDYTLPDGVNEGEIVFYNIMGNEVKRFKVDRTFNTLLISTKDIAAGTYYYQLQTSGESSGGKKMVVIK
jgi:hypothetical protein